MKNYTITYRGIKITQSKGEYKFKFRGEKMIFVFESYDMATKQIDAFLN